MALFVKKTWKDRLTEFPGRRRLKNVSTQAETVFDVTRNEGQTYETGDAYNAINMNNLENRIAAAIGTGDIPTGLGNDIVAAITKLNSDMSTALTYNEETDYFGMVYNGVWRDVLRAGFQKIYLYNKGADNTDLIGNIVASSMAFNRDSGAGKMKPNISRSSNRITFTQPLYESNYTQGSIWFSKAIDFTNYSTLNIHVLDSGSNTTYIYLCKSYNAETSDDIRIMTINSVPADNLSADISTLGGNYYVAFSLLGGNCRITFDELWLE